jgi:hypothetical protein
MPRAPRPYPSDLTDEQWALLEPLLESSDRHGKPTKWPSRHVADAVSSTCCVPVALGGCCLVSIRPGRPSTTTSANGVGTGGAAVTPPQVLDVDVSGILEETGS